MTATAFDMSVPGTLVHLDYGDPDCEHATACKVLVRVTPGAGFSIQGQDGTFRPVTVSMEPWRGSGRSVLRFTIEPGSWFLPALPSGGVAALLGATVQ